MLHHIVLSNVYKVLLMRKAHVDFLKVRENMTQRDNSAKIAELTASIGKSHGRVNSFSFTFGLDYLALHFL